MCDIYVLLSNRTNETRLTELALMHNALHTHPQHAPETDAEAPVVEARSSGRSSGNGWWPEEAFGDDNQRRPS